MSSFSNLLSTLGGTRDPSANARTPPGSSSVANACNSQVSNAAPRPMLSTNVLPDPPTLKRKHDVLASSMPKGSQLSSCPASSAASSTQSVAQNRTRPGLAQPPAKTVPTNRPVVPTAAAAPPPPKGSYREIMQRAQTANVTAQNLGQIKHKAVSKPGKRDRPRTPEPAAKGTPKLRDTMAKGSQRSANPGRARAASASVSPRKRSPAAILGKPKKTPLELGYKGTMRPASPGNPLKNLAKGAPEASKSRPSPYSTTLTDRSTSTSVRHRPPSQAGTSRHRYASESEVEDDDDDHSDASSEDMGGGGFDELMEEEEQSLRAARMEDEEALRQETEHKRRKMARKQALEALAASRRSRG